MAKITRSDIEKIGQLGTHCDQEKLYLAISEAENFDMPDLFCDFWNDIVENWEEIEYTDLIIGSAYEGCNGTRIHSGIKTILSYYAYARYTVLNQFNDTPSGSVSKTNDFSMPKPLKEIQSFSDKYRSMGYVEFERTEAYLCKNRDSFSSFHSNNCKGCGCNGICGDKTNTKGYGLSGKIISKY